MDTARLIGLADNPALDFLNTTGVSAGVAVELLGSGPGYLAWLQFEALISAGDGKVIAGRFRAAELDAAAAEARALREWLRPVVTANGTAIACAAYSTPQAQPRRPCERNGLSASRWVEVRHSIRLASQLSTASNRHILPACGM